MATRPTLVTRQGTVDKIDRSRRPTGETSNERPLYWEVAVVQLRNRPSDPTIFVEALSEEGTLLPDLHSKEAEIEGYETGDLIQALRLRLIHDDFEMTFIDPVKAVRAGWIKGALTLGVIGLIVFAVVSSGILN
ncbi:hypothetical protein [Roseovarius sp.]|uniref:hypothetical protein n=1 Tax=Roseovarius sp. TaxID=1486281 RepID=UPI003A97BC41